MVDSQTTHGCATREEYDEYSNAVEVFIGTLPNRFHLTSDFLVETTLGCGKISEKNNLGYIVKMDDSETCHHGVQLFFTPEEILKWKTVTTPCRRCSSANTKVEVVTSFDEAHDDARFTCKDCRHVWWVDRCDA